MSTRPSADSGSGLGGFLRRLGLGRGHGRAPSRGSLDSEGPVRPDRGPGFETSDINVGSIGWLGVGFTVTALVGAGLLWLGFNFLASLLAPAGPSSPLATIQQVAPGPQLQVSPSTDMQKLKASEDRLLSQYAWVNQQQGIVRIPIDQAMQTLLRRGLPTLPDARLPVTDPGGYFDEGHNLESEGGVPPGAEATAESK